MYTVSIHCICLSAFESDTSFFGSISRRRCDQWLFDQAMAVATCHGVVGVGSGMGGTIFSPESHGKTMGKPWENHGKTTGKPWENRVSMCPKKPIQ